MLRKDDSIFDYFNHSQVKAQENARRYANCSDKQKRGEDDRNALRRMIAVEVEQQYG